MIKALPPAATRIIGSSQVLTDPASAVKELIDNALDARCTAVFVDISANSLDIIQVRDNGHGIFPEDRSMVGRRHCTSKIREYSDMKDIGGKWLGFRGEALACAAELAGNLTITTRVEGEEAGVALRIKRDGELQGQDRTSHPIGTSVRLTDLFKPLPVRKEAALKGSSKCLCKIKRMIQAYTLARPHIRFSLRVLKSKSGAGNWAYVPKANATIQDAAIKVVGQDCAGQCTLSSIKKEGFYVEALLPNPGSDAKKIGNSGSFISVDSRPVVASRGTFKQIVTSFRAKLKASNSGFESLREPFIWMSIDCPIGSYDPNIEPAKDNVIFEDGGKALNVILALFEQCYPSTEIPPTPTKSSSSAEASDLHAREFPTAENYAVSDTERPWKRQKPSTLGIDKAEYEALAGIDNTNYSPEDIDNDDEARSTLRNVNLSNPWIFAKLHASNQPRRHWSLATIHPQPTLHERHSFENKPNSAPRPAKTISHPPLLTPDPSSSPIQERFAAVEPRNRPDSRLQELANEHQKGGRDFALLPNPRPQGIGWVSHNQGMISANHVADREYPESLSPVLRLGNASSGVSSRKPPRAPKQSYSPAINTPFVSPVPKKPTKSSIVARSYNAVRDLQAEQENSDIRTAFSRQGERETTTPLEDAVFRSETNCSNAQRLNFRVDVEGSAPANFDSRQARCQSPCGTSMEPFNAPLEFVSTDNTAQNLVIVLRTSISTLSDQASWADKLNLKLHETGGTDLYPAPWNFFHACLKGSEIPEHAVSEATDLNCHVSTSLTVPPVEMSEMAAWKERVLQYLGTGRYGGPDEMIDIVAAMEDYACEWCCT